MKFDQILLTGSQTIKLFDLRSPRSTPYTARTIDGLGPTEVDVQLGQTSQGTGIYIGRREQLREITVNAYLNPNYMAGETPEQLRDAIYRLRPVNPDLSLDFRLMFDGKEVASTPVYVKTVEISPYSKDNTLQIIVASTSGYLARKDPLVVPNPALDRLAPILVNEGTAMTGFKIKIEITGQVDAIGFVMRTPFQAMSLQKLPGDAALFLSGDIIEIESTIGQRAIRYTRNGVTKSALAALTPDSTWLTLYPGPNQLEYLQSPVTTPPKYLWREFTHTPKYLGV